MIAFTYGFKLETLETLIPHERPDQLPLRMLFGGDIMLGRYVEKYTLENWPDYPFAKLNEFLNSHDLVVANLEGPIGSDDHVMTPAGSTNFSFSSTTPRLLKHNNIQIVSLANNHTTDQGSEVYNNTVTKLREAGITSFGHPISIGDISVATRTYRKHNITFVGFNTTFGKFNATKATLLIENIATSTNPFIIVSVHWGDEYKLYSNAYQRGLGQKFIDAGADLVIGHHPHVTEEFEIYKGRPIFYSLGNFVFDQYFSEDTQEGLIVLLELTDIQARYNLVPISSVKSQPQLMLGEIKESFLNNLYSRVGTSTRNLINNHSLTLGR